MNIVKKKYWFLPLLIFIVSCEVDREAPILLNSAYFPLEIGNFWIYEVDETVYFGEADFETNNYFYRDQITDQYINEAEDPAFTMVRQFSVDRENWENERVFSLVFSQNRLIKHDNNFQEILLVYPVEAGLTWDGNGLNNNNVEFFYVEEKGPYFLNNNSFSETVKVRKSNEDDLITIRDIRFEVFAEEVGMVESYEEVYSYCSRNDCLGEQIIQSGRFKHLKLITNGKN